MIIQVLLLLGLTIVAVITARSRSTALNLVLRRTVTVIAMLLGIAAVMLPNAVTKLANLVGVGRGADLVLYLLVLAFLFVSVGMYRRFRELEDNYVALARRIAIDDALRGNPSAGISRRQPLERNPDPSPSIESD